MATSAQLIFHHLDGRNRVTGFPLQFLLLPGVVAAALLFDRGSGYYASFLGTIFSIVALGKERHSLDAAYLFAVFLFLLLAVALTLVSEGMRRALERAVHAERTKELLLEELAHRLQNSFTMAVSLFMLQARAQENEQSRAALENAAARLRVIADAHRHLNARGDVVVEMQDYLTRLCTNLADALRGVRPIAVHVDCEPITLPSQIAVPLGLIANELVTNAFKHAFTDAAAGNVTARLHRAHGALELIVEDDGKGCPPDAPQNTGSRVVKLLVEQLNGFKTRGGGERGCRATVVFPMPKQRGMT